MPSEIKVSHLSKPRSILCFRSKDSIMKKNKSTVSQVLSDKLYKQINSIKLCLMKSYWNWKEKVSVKYLTHLSVITIMEKICLYLGFSFHKI